MKYINKKYIFKNKSIVNTLKTQPMNNFNDNKR